MRLNTPLFRCRSWSAAGALVLAATLLPTALLHAATPTAAGPTAEQYRLAEQLSPDQVGKLAFRLSIEPQWVDDPQSHFWYWREDAQQPAYVLVNPQTRQRQALFDAAKLAAALSQATGKPVDVAKGLRLGQPVLDKDLHSLRFEWAGQRWRWDRQADKLYAAAKPGDARGVSPDGRWQAYTQAGNLWLRDLSTGKERALTQDGSAQQPYAQQLVNPEQLFNGTLKQPSDAISLLWSPDSSRVATVQLDLREAATLTLVQAVPPGRIDKRPRAIDYPYALSGDEKTARARFVVFEAASGARVDMQLPAQPVLYYGMLHYEWDKNSRLLYTELPERGYAALHLYRLDAVSGAATAIVSETQLPFVDYYGMQSRILSEHQELYWTSDASGWKHLQRHDLRTGKRLATLTSGPWRIGSLLRAAPKRGQVFFTGLGREPDRDPYYRHLYRVSTEGKDLRLLTPEPLDHEVSVSPDLRFFVDNLSAPHQPTRTVLRDAQDGRILMALEQADIEALKATGWQPPEPFQAKAADGVTPLYGLLYRPIKVQPQRRYAVVEHIYTGPHTSTTPKSFGRALRTVLLPFTALDFAGVYVDGRGGARRSRAFLEHAYQNLGEVYEDHELTLRQLAAHEPSLDMDRVGLFGFSAGGYDTVRAMLTRPDFYKVGWAASGNHDHRSDKAVWNEQWMGYPLNPLYERHSNLSLAHQLKGRLMLAHGELDSNVNPMATLQLVHALIQAGKRADQLWVPGAGHFLDDLPYVNRYRWDYFIEHLQGRKPLP